VPREVKRTFSVSTRGNGPGEDGGFVGEPYCLLRLRASDE
jgi:hypothetical protein